MKPFLWSVKGRGVVEVYRHGKLRYTSPDQNMILDNFWNWVSSQSALSSISASVKIGTGSTPTDPTMTALEAPAALTTGLWPSVLNQSGEIATVVQGGTQLRTVINFEFSFAVGQVEGNITEYGIDLTATTQPSDAGVHTRVLTKDELGQPTAIPVTLIDQLVLRYQIEMTAPMDIAPYTLSIDKDGVVQNHQVKMIWGPATNFVGYLNHAGYRHAAPSVRVGYAANIAGDLTVQSLDEQAIGGVMNWTYSPGKVTAPIQLTGEQGNLASGINIIQGDSAQSWWRFHIDPPIQKVQGQNFGFTVERPNRGMPIIPDPEPEPTPDPITSYTLNGWAWKDHGETEFPNDEMTSSNDVAVWDNGELQVGMVLSANVFDNVALTSAPVGNVWEITIPDDVAYSPYSLMAFGFGMYEGRDGQKAIGEYYDFAVRIYNDVDDHTYDVVPINLGGGQAYYDLAPRDSGPILGEDSIKTSYGTILPYYAGAIEWQTWKYYPGSSLNTIFGPFEEWMGSSQVGEWNVSITATPKAGGTPIQADMLFRVLKGADAGGGGGGEGGEPITGFTKGTWKWPAQDDATLFHNDEPAPLAIAETYDDGVRQAAFLAGVGDDRWAWTGPDGSVEGVWDVEVRPADNAYAYITVGVGQYADRAPEVSLETVTDAFLTFTVDGASQRYKLGRHPTQANVAWFKEVGEFTDVWEETATYFSGLNQSYGNPTYYGSVEAAKFVIYVQEVADMFPGKFTAFNTWDQIGGFTVTLTVGAKGMVGDYISASYIVSVTEEIAGPA